MVKIDRLNSKVLAGLGLISLMSLKQVNSETMLTIVSSLSLLQLLVLKLRGSVLIDRMRLDGWKIKIPLQKQFGWPDMPFPALIMVGYLLGVSYYGTLEGIWGISVGKAACGLRVVSAGGMHLDLGTAFLRSSLFCGSLVVVSYLTKFISIDLGGGPGFLNKIEVLMRPEVPICMGLLFSTARRINGFAALHDLCTGTRVVEKADLRLRPASIQVQDYPEIESVVRIGPYSVIGTLKASTRQEILSRMMTACDAKFGFVSSRSEPRPFREQGVNWRETVACAGWPAGDLRTGAGTLMKCPRESRCSK